MRKYFIVVGAVVTLGLCAALVIFYLPRGSAASIRTASPPTDTAVTAVAIYGNALEVESRILSFGNLALSGGALSGAVKLGLQYEKSSAASVLPRLIANEAKLRDEIIDALKSWTPEDLESYYPNQEKAIALVNRLNDFLRDDAQKTPIIQIVVESALGN